MNTDIEQRERETAIDFFKWYYRKFTGLMEYLIDIKPRVRSEEIEQKIEEFEGKSLDELFSQYLLHKKVTN